MKEIVLITLRFIAKNWFLFSLLALGLYAALSKAGGNGAMPTMAKSAKMSDSGEELGLLAEAPVGAKFMFPEMPEQVEAAFVERFRKVALAEQKKFGIPASVILACAYHNSIGGSRLCASECNNFFALPCDKNWDGEKKIIDQRCYKQYGTAWESFRDFSIWVVGLDEYARLRKKAPDKPELWLKALADQGFSDVNDFERLCLKFIKKYQLGRLDC